MFARAAEQCSTAPFSAAPLPAFPSHSTALSHVESTLNINLNLQSNFRFDLLFDLEQPSAPIAASDDDEDPSFPSTSPLLLSYPLD